MRRLLSLCCALRCLAGCDQNMDAAAEIHRIRAGAAVPQRPGAAGAGRRHGGARRSRARRGGERQAAADAARCSQRGREQFDIFCSPCHGRVGNGDGMIVQRGMPQPPDFHDERLRGVPDQHIFDVITTGYGVMYSYAARVRPRDRWAIVAYIRALQLSQHATLDDVPPPERARLMAEEPR